MSGMPWQLRNAKRPKRSEPKPLIELTPNIDTGELCRQRAFPENNYERWTLEMPFKYPFVKNLVISRQIIEVNHHLGYTQRIGIHWIRTGFGRPRPIFICECGYGFRRLFFRCGHLACKDCHGLTYASRALGKRTRPILQAIRLRKLLELKSYMSKRNRQRLAARLTPAVTQELISKRLSHHTIQLPQSNYGTRGAMLWR
jgi:hypothetical protein